ncbi:BA75_04169T0 [Komagataella pastoris]|uniref:BA75_04169T0 n=1 Tax=Komagataella pastoris TaxID=4922 RepID=A0A1B2JEX3_PICPA|nr:BA75_04169T0 [Komagataella pastoris]
MSVIRKHGQHHSQRPYDPPEGSSPKSGLFNKVRGFLFGDISKDQQSVSSGQSQVSTFNRSTQITQERPPISPALFKKVNQSNTSILPSSPVFSTLGDDVSIQQSPSARLAKFFTEKGDQPLSDVEIQGVLSLMNQSARYQDDASTVQSTPKILRPQTVEPIKSTPKYKPSFNSPANKSMDVYSTRKKRLIEFSSLPSPYRVRISSPLASLISKQEIKKIEEVPKKETPKPLSGTANALEGLLNQNQKEANPKPEVSRFANPYVSGLKKLSRTNGASKPAVSQPTKVVEKVQEKPKLSILEKMQQTAPKDDLLGKKNDQEQAPTTVLSKPEVPAQQTPISTPQNDKQEPKKLTPPSTVETEKAATKPVFNALSTAPISEPPTTETKPLFSFTPSTQSTKPPTIQPSNGFSLTKGERIAQAPKSLESQEFSRESTQDSSKSHQPPVPVLLSQNKFSSIEYQFPTVESKTLELDSSKVAQFESSFVF